MDTATEPPNLDPLDPPQRGGLQPPTPLDWRKLCKRHLEGAAYVTISWAGGPNAESFFAIGEDREITLIEIESNGGGKQRTIQTEHGHSSPSQLADLWWSECFEQLKIQQGRRPRLSQIIGCLELYDKEQEQIGRSAKIVRELPDGGAAEVSWVSDAETEGDRRDRSLLMEMRRERAQLFGIAERAMETSAASIERMASAVNMMQEERESRITQVRNEAEDAAIMVGADSQDSQAFQFLMELMRDTKQSHVNRPGPDGVDELVSECRAIARLVEPDGWAKLVKVDAKFSTLRDAINGSIEFDASRATVRESLLAALAVLSQMEGADPATVREALGVTASEKIAGLNKLLQD